MGNTWKGVDDVSYKEAEQKLLAYSGIPIDEFEITNVIIDKDDNYVRTIQVGDRTKEKLVIVHGYGGFGLIFYKIMKQLAENYHCIYIDIIGMGASSRPRFYPINAEEADMFFVNFLENWRRNFYDLKDFFLAGHSFGGYICGHYAYRYPQYIKKLLMLSPAGVVKKSKEMGFTERRQKRGEETPYLIQLVVQTFWSFKLSPFDFMRTSGSWLGRFIINSYLTKRMSNLPQQELMDLMFYMQQVLMREKSTEHAVFLVFQLGYFAKHPLESKTRLGDPNLPIPVSFFYGDSDWMDYRGGERVVYQNKFYRTLSDVYLVDNSDHHMYFDNPQEFARLMIYDIELTLQNEHLIKEYKKQVLEGNMKIETHINEVEEEQGFNGTKVIPH